LTRLFDQHIQYKGIKVNVDMQGKHPAPRRSGAGRQFGSDLDIAIK